MTYFFKVPLALTETARQLGALVAPVQDPG